VESGGRGASEDDRQQQKNPKTAISGAVRTAALHHCERATEMIRAPELHRNAKKRIEPNPEGLPFVRCSTIKIRRAAGRCGWGGRDRRCHRCCTSRSPRPVRRSSRAFLSVARDVRMLIVAVSVRSPVTAQPVWISRALPRRSRRASMRHRSHGLPGAQHNGRQVGD